MNDLTTGSKAALVIALQNAKLFYKYEFPAYVIALPRDTNSMLDVHNHNHGHIVP